MVGGPAHVKMPANAGRRRLLIAASHVDSGSPARPSSMTCTAAFPVEFGMSAAHAPLRVHLRICPQGLHTPLHPARCLIRCHDLDHAQPHAWKNSWDCASLSQFWEMRGLYAPHNYSAVVGAKQTVC